MLSAQILRFACIAKPRADVSHDTIGQECSGRNDRPGNLCEPLWQGFDWTAKEELTSNCKAIPLSFHWARLLSALFSSHTNWLLQRNLLENTLLDSLLIWSMTFDMISRANFRLRGHNDCFIMLVAAGTAGKSVITRKHWEISWCCNDQRRAAI